MGTKRPWQIPALVISYVLGILYMINFIYYEIGNKISIQYFCITATPILIFIILIAALFIRRPWAYNMSIALLIFICIFSCINILYIFFMPNIWLVIIPISGLFTIYAIFCSATRIYFGVKKEKLKY